MKYTVILLLAFVVGALSYALDPTHASDDWTLDWNMTDVDSPQSNCGGNCPGGCSTCPCGTTKHVVDIKYWCGLYKGWNQACCHCIVSHESGGNTNAVNQNKGGSLDVGLWQINSVNWKSCSGGSAPCHPDTNLGCAKKVWEWGGKSFKLWSTCKACGCC